jgi:capsular polysaccharide biosynthesis protein
VTDLTLEQLVQYAISEQNNFNQVQDQYGQAALALSNAESTSGGVSIVDPPQGASPVSHKKKEVFAGIAGLLLGVMVSILATTAFVATDKTARQEEDLQQVEGLEVVAQIGHVRSSRRSHDQHRDHERVSKSS